MQTDYIKNIEDAERRMVAEPIEFREEGEDQYFEGYAFVYETRTDIGEFTEEIAKGAADEVMQDDVRGLFNHDVNIVLGRTSSGTMQISTDERGMKYRIKYNPNDPDHVRVREKVKRGDISQSSFAFKKKEDKWEMRDGKKHRTVLKFKRMIDVSPVTYAAYNDATVAMRSMNLIDNDYKKDLAEMEIESMRRELNF